MRRLAVTLALALAFGRSRPAAAAAPVPRTTGTTGTTESLVVRSSRNAPDADGSFVTSTGSARPIPERRLEVALFQPTRYGLTSRVELATQTLLLPLMPQVEAKVLWWSAGPYFLGTRQRLAYPKPLLDTLAKEGSFGLLPATSRIPHALIVDLDGLFTLEPVRGQLVTALAGLSVAPRGDGSHMPLLDFPFLYARFAVLKTTAVYRLGLAYDGEFGSLFRLATDLRWFALPVIAGGYSVEAGLSLRFLLSRHVALEGGGRIESARYPAGVQFHYLPFVDVLAAW